MKAGRRKKAYRTTQERWSCSYLPHLVDLWQFEEEA